MKNRRFLVLNLSLTALLLGLLPFGLLRAEAESSKSSRNSTAQAAQESSDPLAAHVAALKPVARLETYKDLIEKAQNLTLQRDRLQASQVLIRGLQKENKNSQAYRELLKALDSLAGLFYSEKAHGLFSSAEAIAENKPKEAADIYAEAIRLEDSNLTLLKALARAQLIQLECNKADATVIQAEGVDPYSVEVKLLRLQVVSCQKSFHLLKTMIVSEAAELEPIQRFIRALEVEATFLDRGENPVADFKRVKTLLTNWENKDPEYPELYFWKWKFYQTLITEDEAEALAPPAPDKAAKSAALKYIQVCQSITARKRKSYALDFRLCRGIEEADAFLKSTGGTASPTPEAMSSSSGILNSPTAPLKSLDEIRTQPTTAPRGKSIKGKSK